MDIRTVISTFKQEFSPVIKKFTVSDMSLPEADKSLEPHVWKPGVYVFWNPSHKVIKVGRHLKNSRMRAFQHVNDNTKGQMGSLRNDPDARLILFNVVDPSDKHWVAAVEIYLEEKLCPYIKSERRG